ncbi:MAG: hypothetical protein A3H49_03085 [Nitrospirae bacterium RIFCSPLOWO2_02_FULL_62_14]|nr:MAG: hypothetical protein A3H49_03085 [Nitrospirae bacterium RIFCSPLOWO2_02_FULL_62_14]
MRCRSCLDSQVDVPAPVTLQPIVPIQQPEVSACRFGIGGENFASADPLTEKLDVISLKPAKANISVKLVALAWVSV